MGNGPLIGSRRGRGSYLHGPLVGPDGWFHLCWVWRDSWDSATNHDLSYARSRDLVAWENAAGQPLATPLGSDATVSVDPVPVNGGFFNNNMFLGFDHQRRPVISYQKFDAAGNTQLYNARLENGAWTIYQTSRWTSRWELRGLGTADPLIRFDAVRPEQPGRLSQWFRHHQEGAGVWTLDENALAPVRFAKGAARVPAALIAPRAGFPGAQVQWAGDAGPGEAPKVRYLLRWETLEENGDRPRAGYRPENSRLLLCRFEDP